MLKLALVFLLGSNVVVYAIEDNVRLNCTGDYFRVCSDTIPGSEDCKQCFRDNGRSLSRKCRDALRQSNEFANDYENQRKRYMSQ